MARFDFNSNLNYIGSCRLPSGVVPTNYSYSGGGWTFDGDTVWFTSNDSDAWKPPRVGKLTLPGTLAPQGTPYASLPSCTHQVWYTVPAPFDTEAYVTDNATYYPACTLFGSSYVLCVREQYYNNVSTPFNTIFAMRVDGVPESPVGWYLSGRYHNQISAQLITFPNWLVSLTGCTHGAACFDKSIIAMGNMGPTLYGFTPNLSTPGALAPTVLIEHDYDDDWTYPMCGGGMPQPFMGTYNGVTIGVGDRALMIDSYQTVGCRPGGVAVMQSGEARCIAFGGLWARGDMPYDYGNYPTYHARRVVFYSASDIVSVVNGDMDARKLLPYATWNPGAYLIEGGNTRRSWKIPEIDNRIRIVIATDGIRLGIAEELFARGPMALHFFDII